MLSSRLKSRKLTRKNKDLLALNLTQSNASLFTQAQDSGTPTWTWNTSSARLEALGSGQAMNLYSGLSATDVVIEFALSQANNTGVTFRYRDQNNFYLAFANDDTSNASINLQVWKRVAGTFTQVGSNVDLTFPRGTATKFRVEAVGNTITVYAGGVKRLSLVDTSHTTPGKVGAYHNNAGTAGYFTAFSAQRYTTPLTDGASIFYTRP